MPALPNLVRPPTGSWLTTAPHLPCPAPRRAGHDARSLHLAYYEVPSELIAILRVQLLIHLRLSERQRGKSHQATTLLLRLLAPGAVMQEALAELVRLPEDAWKRAVALPHLIAWRIALMQDLDEMKAEDQKTLMSLDELYAQWKRKVEEEGRREGRREGQRSTLLRLLRARFGVLPEAAVAQVEAAEAPQLDAWVDRVVTAASLDEVLREA